MTRRYKKFEVTDEEGKKILVCPSCGIRLSAIKRILGVVAKKRVLSVQPDYICLNHNCELHINLKKVETWILA